jgi:F420-non-reducing hydrogenase iron-sulfur subunit
MQEWHPTIVSFLCNWCSYGAADLAGVSRMQYPPDLRVIRIPCTGSMNPKFILQAFRQGVDGVWVSGWHPGDCHYISGNLFARRRFVVFKNLMEYIGLEPGRLHFSWISSSEAGEFQNKATEVVEAVRALGPAKRLVKDIRPEEAGAREAR